MTRRAYIVSFFAASLHAATDGTSSLRGKLRPGEKPMLATSDGRLIGLSGDSPTMQVLNDKRLAGVDFEVVGRFQGTDRFLVDPIHKKSMFVHKQGKPLMISYWCDVCAIRTYAPGICMCCQEETALDLN
ncbi:MAG: hypothetical protein JJE04_22325 [Acidobacteriia bacterium]|nr:hypothetical protein [Terriglobia bacterium]